MKIIFISVVLIGLFSQICFSMPLVFKAEKVVKSDGKTNIEIISFNTSKYKNARIGIVLSESDLDNYGSAVYVHAVEEGNSMFIGSIMLYKDNPNRTNEFANLPTKIQLTTRKTGRYQIYIWAE